MFIEWNLSLVRDVVLCFEYSLEENCSIKKSKNVWDRIVQYYWESFIINDTKINYITDIIIWFNLKSKGTLTFVYRNLLGNREFQKYKKTSRAYMFKGFILYITVPFLFIIVQEMIYRSWIVLFTHQCRVSCILVYLLSPKPHHLYPISGTKTKLFVALQNF